MAQFAGHWYSGRAARLVAVELSLVALALWIPGRHAQTLRQLVALVTAAGFIPLALYLADLYDPQVMRADRAHGVSLLKALGFAAVAAGFVGLVGPAFGGALPRGALIDTMGVASIGVLLTRAALVTRIDGESHSRVLIVGTGNRAQEIARLIRLHAFGEYEVAGTLDPAVDLADAGRAELRAVSGAMSGDPALPGIAQGKMEPRGQPQGPQLVQAQLGSRDESTLLDGKVMLATSPEVVQNSSLIVAPGPNPLPSDEVATAQMQGGQFQAAQQAGLQASQQAHSPFASIMPHAATLVVPASSLRDAVQRLRADTLVIASDEQRSRLPVEELIRLRLEGVTVLPAHRFAERVLRRVPLSLLRPSDLAFGHGLTSPLGLAIKRVFDLVMSAALLAVASPVLAFLAVLIKLESKGPVFYSQERVGRGGKPYRIHKLRSMREDAETGSGPVWATQKDPRVTRIGAVLRKTRLDEIPQVFAVFRGDMSFVGPRPERPFFVEQLRRQIPFYGLREAVKPGITGWAQIRYPYGATVEDSKNKLEFDLYYVEHQSLFLDLAICFHTAKIVLFGRGAR